MHAETHIFDSDADKPDRNGSRVKHEKDNKALLALLGWAKEDAMPAATLWGHSFVMWHSDIGEVVKDEVGEANWFTYSAEADKQYGHAGGLQKNILHIASILEQAWTAGNRSASLERVCREILDSANHIMDGATARKTADEQLEIHILSKAILKPGA